jgi:hypothetical protein
MFKSFKDFINEAFVNAFSDSDKSKYVDIVWNMLHAAYESQGGMFGTGFTSKEDMIKNIPFWKIGKTDGVINSVMMYKDKDGRKRVSIATNGTPAGKERLLEMMLDDLKLNRAFGEVSGRSLSFLCKNINVVPYAVKPEEVQKKLKEEIRPVPSNDPEIRLHPELKDFFYQRHIGTAWHTKVMLGNLDSSKITNF